MSNQRVIQGKVVKVAGIKTATIIVERKVMHPKYHKTVKRFKKYLIHDEKSELEVNDVVTAIECRPISKTKSYRLNNIVSKGVK
ncbi:MAG: 30S ribosomal protein S17 [Campylobacteraceae bacterium 4484_166]|nr:MAG: 30S ribosomal protein S17 [Campylobacteraceae bacterium 4484_166]